MCLARLFTHPPPWPPETVPRQSPGVATCATPFLVARYVHSGEPMTPKVQVGTILVEERPPDRPGSWVGERALLRRLEPQHAMTAAAKARLCVAIKRYFVTLLNRGHVEEVAPESLRRESRCRQKVSRLWTFSGTVRTNGRTGSAAGLQVVVAMLQGNGSRVRSIVNRSP
jgi:hypothetical protein